METNLIVNKTTKLIELLEFIFSNEANRIRYLNSPKAIQNEFELEGEIDFESMNNLFYRFIKDDEIWSLIEKRDSEKLEKLIVEKFPELKSNDIENAALFINDVLVANNSIVGGQQFVVALSTIKVVAAVVGISNTDLN